MELNIKIVQTRWYIQDQIWCLEMEEERKNIQLWAKQMFHNEQNIYQIEDSILDKNNYNLDEQENSKQMSFYFPNFRIKYRQQQYENQYKQLQKISNGKKLILKFILQDTEFNIKQCISLDNIFCGQDLITAFQIQKIGILMDYGAEDQDSFSIYTSDIIVKDSGDYYSMDIDIRIDMNEDVIYE
ncbi:hypothetical protein PPERSA_02650 [Pseudocohnilembus persalinus]|uniref:Uncharacterized protein n=1 Tax=Pseudocohnilembus persalinus TaxID=266149 RepID=A0A0V0R5K8_PSEPJ|nr:hypothetical protein PPERSA_02650 [Pseudocohnilembus persalinus]|eukprot:KRX09778.1 hypothetical protein PPERSA_02650 [Pseudocohnilembus persalinus]